MALGQLIWHKVTAIPLYPFSGCAPVPYCPCHKENRGEQAIPLHLTQTLSLQMDSSCIFFTLPVDTGVPWRIQEGQFKIE